MVKTDAEILKAGYGILEGSVDEDALTREEWRHFEELRDEEEEAAFLEAEDEFYEET